MGYYLGSSFKSIILLEANDVEDAQQKLASAFKKRQDDGFDGTASEIEKLEDLNFRDRPFVSEF